MNVRFGAGMAAAMMSMAMIGCGGGGDKTAAKDSTATAPAAKAADSTGGATGGAMGGATASYMAPTGKTWEVKMLGDAQGYRFDPKTLTVKKGDAVKFIMVSGGPHDVTFWADSIPSGAFAQLNANMQNHTADLTAPMTINPNETYIVSFAGVTDGLYKYYCTPHLAMGMVAQITVEN